MLLVPANPDHTGKHEREKHPFDAVDWEATVYVNGKKVGSHTGGYDPFYFDITSALTDGGEQEIAVYIHDNTGAEGQPKGKQALNKWGCWYTPVSGIWQTVWLEPVNPVHITRLSIEPDVDNSCFKLQVNTTGDSEATADIRLSDPDGNTVASLQGVATGLACKRSGTVVAGTSLPLRPQHHTILGRATNRCRKKLLRHAQN